VAGVDCARSELDFLYIERERERERVEAEGEGATKGCREG
jgi:hypothetical protein